MYVGMIQKPKERWVTVSKDVRQQCKTNRDCAAANLVIANYLGLHHRIIRYRMRALSRDRGPI